MHDAINKAAIIVTNHCIKHRIDTIVFVMNKDQKQEAELEKANQPFV